jgi:lipopolysaccharide/colanic/teichoic acid biosynthesis glycosyltransferase
MTCGKRNRDANSPLSRDKNDARITRIGKIIRKLSIDEIPNLFNVLKGELKIIGVRPCEEEEIQYLPPERFKYLPGMSGITSREGSKNPSLEEQYDTELYFSTHYGKEVKRMALRNGFKVIWNNK